MRIFFLLFVYIFATCGKKNDNSYIYGQLPLSSFKVKEKCLSCDNKYYSVFFDESSGWLTLDNYSDELLYSAKFEIITKKKGSILKIFNSDFIGLNGDYSIRIDTISTSPQRDEIAISLQSSDVIMKGYKNMIKKR